MGWSLYDDNQVIKKNKGILPRPGMQPVSVETMNDVIKQK